MDSRGGVGGEKRSCLPTPTRSVAQIVSALALVCHWRRVCGVLSWVALETEEFVELIPSVCQG